VSRHPSRPPVTPRQPRPSGPHTTPPPPAAPAPPPRPAGPKTTPIAITMTATRAPVSRSALVDGPVRLLVAGPARPAAAAGSTAAGRVTPASPAGRDHMARPIAGCRQRSLRPAGRGLTWWALRIGLRCWVLAALVGLAAVGGGELLMRGLVDPAALTAACGLALFAATSLVGPVRSSPRTGRRVRAPCRGGPAHAPIPHHGSGPRRTTGRGHSITSPDRRERSTWNTNSLAKPNR
jgi:hypothetical protein